MNRWRAVLGTSARAVAWILLASAAVIGVVLLLGLLAGDTPAQIHPQAWSPGGALVGVLRLGSLAAVGVAITALALAVDRRRPRGKGRFAG